MVHDQVQRSLSEHAHLSANRLRNRASAARYAESVLDRFDNREWWSVGPLTAVTARDDKQFLNLLGPKKHRYKKLHDPTMEELVWWVVRANGKKLDRNERYVVAP